MSGGFMLTPEEMREVRSVSAQSLAARYGIDANGALADGTRPESDRVRAVSMQVAHNHPEGTVLIQFLS